MTCNFAKFVKNMLFTCKHKIVMFLKALFLVLYIFVMYIIPLNTLTASLSVNHQLTQLFLIQSS